MKTYTPKTRFHWFPLWLGLYAGILIFSLTALATTGTPDHQVFQLTTSIVKLSAIALNLIFAILYFRNDQLLALALLFTLIADIFLDQNAYPFGLAIFACAQFAHLCRLSPTRKLPLVYLAIIAIYLLICIFCRLPLIVFAGAPYALFLFTNLILAWVQSGTPNAPGVSLGLGFTLFLLCDACVLLSYLCESGLLLPELKPLADYASWIFYYPSQVLIATTPLKNLATTEQSVLQ